MCKTSEELLVRVQDTPTYTTERIPHIPSISHAPLHTRTRCESTCISKVISYLASHPIPGLRRVDSAELYPFEYRGSESLPNIYCDIRQQCMPRN